VAEIVAEKISQIQPKTKICSQGAKIQPLISLNFENSKIDVVRLKAEGQFEMP